MKLSKLIALLMLITNGTVVFAQSNSQEQAPVVGASAVGQQPSMESSTSLQKAVPAATPKSWGASYLNETRYERADAFNGTGAMKIDHRFGVTYKLQGGTLGLYQTWRQTQDMQANTAKVQNSDPFVRFVFNTVKMNHDWTLEPSVRFYAPTSETSQMNSQNGRLRSTLEFKRPLNGRLGFYYAFDGNYYMQKNLSSYKAEGKVANQKVASKNTGDVGERAGYAYEANKRYDMYNVFGLDYQINKKWTFQQQIAIQNVYTYADAAHNINHRNEDTFEVWSYLNYEAAPGVAFVLGLEQVRNAEARTAEPTYNFMADNETNYYLSISVGI